uniref:DUF58 domain-containing protein n=1 Tax=candidate division WOR-3 bacterium TaxID=2052148 RepID=A0A7V4E3C3_UNCW3
MKYLLSKVICKIKRLDLRAKLVVEGFLSGLHKSSYKGQAIEFADYRPYLPGDELKRIDWKIFAKTDKFWVREYEEETNLRAYLFLDTSGSMKYKSKEISKFEYASFLAAAFAYLLFKQHDSVGLALFNKNSYQYLPPQFSKSHLAKILEIIESVKPEGETDIYKSLTELGKKIKKRGLIIIFSDFFDKKENILKGLKNLRHKKNEVLVFHILDPNEINLNYEEPLIFKDLETRREIKLDPRSIKKEYQETLKKLFLYYKQECAAHYIDYNLIFTNMPFDYAFLSYLAKRAKIK